MSDQRRQEIRRVLFLGFPFEKSIEDEIKNGLKRFQCFFSPLFPNYVLYDYDLIVLNLPHFSGWRIRDLLDKRREFDIFLKAGKILVCILDEPREYDTYNNYYWLDFGYFFQTNLRKGLGEVVIANRESKFYKIFGSIFEKFNFKWNVDLPETPSHYQIENFDVLAVNNVNIPISFVIELKEKYGGGKIVFIPPLAETDKEKIKGFYISLVNASAQLYKPISHVRITTTPPPTWINEFSCPNETELYAQKEKIEKLLDECFNAKKLLYEKGYALVPPVALVFKKLGYETDIRERLGEEDIILKSDNFVGIVEVKGFESEKHKIDRGKAYEIIGRLMNYLSSYGEEIETKPILVVNYDIEKHPNQRRQWKEIFTPPAIKVLQSSNVVVLSSYQLFKIYSKLIEDKTDEYKNKIRKKILETSGLFEL